MACHRAVGPGQLLVRWSLSCCGVLRPASEASACPPRPCSRVPGEGVSCVMAGAAVVRFSFVVRPSLTPSLTLLLVASHLRSPHLSPDAWSCCCCDDLCPASNPRRVPLAPALGAGLGGVSWVTDVGRRVPSLAPLPPPFGCPTRGLHLGCRGFCSLLVPELRLRLPSLLGALACPPRPC